MLRDMGDFLRNSFVLKNKTEKDENSTYTLVVGHRRYRDDAARHCQ